MEAKGLRCSLSPTLCILQATNAAEDEVEAIMEEEAGTMRFT